MKNMFVNKLAEVAKTSISKKEVYDLNFIMATGKKFQKGSKLLGGAASNIIALQSAAIDSKKLNNKLSKLNIDMEAIVDASVQGSNMVEAMASIKDIKDLFKWSNDNKIHFNSIMKQRLPWDMRENVTYEKDGVMDQLYEFLVKAIDATDKRILGEGSVENGRNLGLIDSVKVDVTPFLLYIKEIPAWLSKEAGSVLFSYSSGVAKLMDSTKNLPIIERTEAREGVREIQANLLISMSRFSNDECKLMVAKWAKDCYSSDKAVHDSHLFIDSMEIDGVKYTGTFEYFLELLQDIGLAKRVNVATTSAELFKVLLGQRKEVEKGVETKDVDTNNIRKQIKVWRPKSDGPVTVEMLTGTNEVLIENGKALLGDFVLNINSVSTVSDGVYAIAKVEEILDKNKKVITTGVSVIIK